MSTLELHNVLDTPSGRYLFQVYQAPPPVRTSPVYCQHFPLWSQLYQCERVFLVLSELKSHNHRHEKSYEMSVNPNLVTLYIFVENQIDITKFW